MATKNFNWKLFMVQKGERVAVGVAGGLLLLILLCQVLPDGSFLKAGPAKNAETLKKAAQNLNQQLVSGIPGPADKPTDEEVAGRPFEVVIAKPAQFASAPLFEAPVPTLNANRRQPELLVPVEGKAKVIQAQVWQYIFDGDKIKVRLGGPMDAQGPMPGGTATDPRILEQQKQREALQRLLTSQRSRQGLKSLKREGMKAPTTNDFADPNVKVVTEFVPFEQLGEKKNASLIKTIRPVNMVEIVAAFPYREQVEEFKRQLHTTSDEVLKEESHEDEEIPADDATGTALKTKLNSFRFLGVVVERRQVDLQGRPLFPDEGKDKGYKEINPGEGFKTLLVQSLGQTQPEDPDHEKLLLDGLVMYRPLAAREYPALEKELDKIKTTVEKLKKANKAAGAAPRTNPRPDNFGTFSRPPVTLPGGEQGASGGPRPSGAQQKPGLGAAHGSAGAADEPPDYCLIRVIDVTVKPGESYQYRIRVRMANPNLGRDDVADSFDAVMTNENNKELKPSPTKGTWFVVPDVVSLPADMHYYVVDQKAVDGQGYKGNNARGTVSREQTVLQIHKFIENAGTGQAKNIPVGEWSVAERVILSRGEIIDRPVRTPMPIYFEDEEKWKLAQTKDLGANPDPGIDVPFEGVKGHPAILVDFDGGTAKEPGGQEVLILGPDGRLRAHYAEADKENPERKKLLQEWRDRLEATNKQGGASDPNSKPKTGGRPFGSK